MDRTKEERSGMEKRGMEMDCSPLPLFRSLAMCVHARHDMETDHRMS